ncbi:MAG: hypothetical protein E5W55_17405 [Mesorhizobium sp.]|nr:MAG: hypothetical protein E5W55_17405 [Mesorhizobium sp.]
MRLDSTGDAAARAGRYPDSTFQPAGTPVQPSCETISGDPHAAAAARTAASSSWRQTIVLSEAVDADPTEIIPGPSADAVKI